MRSRVEKFIPIAIETIKSVGIAQEDGTVPKQFNGYISSFAASIRQAGLLATILFYGNANSNAEQDRKKVIDAIEKIIQKPLMKNNRLGDVSRDEIEDAATALKLAVRTCKLQ
jgi:CRISPR-associated protein Cmr5